MKTNGSNGLAGLRKYYGDEGLERLLKAPSEVTELKAQIKGMKSSWAAEAELLRFRWKLAAAVASVGLASWGAHFAAKFFGGP